ncbi:DNA topoisomerase IB [Leucobacter weissii]|uniref:DNA topoisomerase n=1 Tax=Leucobacter weissii TaxID=1983706 RepID=A0A939MKG8_9MICO|nr:DNA topoisomerase IB [Leucobacter weissii]MBO1902423.1 DNA topoisomerase IB [Leucobacter weissii]
MGGETRPRSRKRRAERRSLTITRRREDDAFVYLRRGRRIRSRREIERIEALVIPPAWEEVRIAHSPRAKVLAIGVDQAGRRQSIYHPSFRRRREREKYARLTEFADALPKLRARVDRDLRRRGLPKDRVVACVIRLIDLHYFRVGNHRYAELHQSYGVTTLTEEHVEASAGGLRFDFTGKSGKRQRVRARDARAARVVSQLLEIPGPEVFRFFDEDGVLRRVRSRDVNAYVRRHTGGGAFTAKDFRTWGGTLIACAELFASDAESWASPESRAAATRAIVQRVAERLGNTPAVAKGSYIAPRLLELCEDPEAIEAARRERSRLRERTHFSVDEQSLVRILRS